MASNVIDYVLKKYPRTFKNKQILVEENNVCYFVSTNKYESPLILSKKNMNKSWSLSFGFYPGVLLGIRSYHEEQQTTHVLYIPFIDLALEIFD